MLVYQILVVLVILDIIAVLYNSYLYKKYTKLLREKGGSTDV